MKANWTLILLAIIALEFALIIFAAYPFYGVISKVIEEERAKNK